MGGDFGYTKSMQKYQKVLQAAKESAKDVLNHVFVRFKALEGIILENETIHFMPDGYDASVNVNGDCYVFLSSGITPKKEEPKQEESQEEIHHNP